MLGLLQYSVTQDFPNIAIMSLEFFRGLCDNCAETGCRKCGKNGKDINLKSNLEKISGEKFVFILAGATDFYRREQILSQQCQKVDQFGFEVYDNIYIQLDKLKQMEAQLSSVLKQSVGRDCQLSDFEVLDKHLFSNLKTSLTDILTTGKFRNEPFAKSFSEWRVSKEEAPKQAVQDLIEYLTKLINSLESRFKGDFNSKFIQEVKDVFDFNFMISLANEEDQVNVKTKLKDHGVESLKKLIQREAANKKSYEREALILSQYNSFKEFCYNLLGSTQNRNIDELSIKNNALVESAVCNKCHQRFNMKDISKHVKKRHENQNIEFSDAFATYSSLKLLHGVCHFPKYNVDKKEFLALTLKLAFKTLNEAVVESIGSVLSLHSVHNRNCLQTTYHNEVMIDWNGPGVSKADNIIQEALDLHFNSRNKWHFKVAISKFGSQRWQIDN